MAIGGSHVCHAGILHHPTCGTGSGHHVDIGAAGEAGALGPHGELLRVAHHLLLLLLLLLLMLLMLLMLLLLLRWLIGVRALTRAWHVRVLRGWGAIGEAIVSGVHGRC